jgi:allene oxide cyclase
MKRLEFLVAGTLAMSSMVSAAGAERLRLIEHTEKEVTVDLGAKGDSSGDLLTFANTVFDAADRTQVGATEGHCLRIVPGKSWECSFTLTLKDGQLSITGPYLDGNDSTMAVIGGTGRFAGARGTMALHARDSQGRRFDFTFELL